MSLPKMEDMPEEGIELFNNFPNPATTSTTISYSIKKPGQVSLKLFDITGVEVACIVNCYQKAGTYSVSFDTSKLANGFYVYVLELDHIFVESKKLIVAH